MKCFGVNAFAARLPNVLVGLLSILLLYKMAIRYYGQQAAIASVILYIGSFTPHLYFRSGIIDPLFNLLIFLAIALLFWTSRFERKGWLFFLAGLSLGAAVLTKGPVAILIAGLTGLIYQIATKRNFYRFSDLLLLVGGLVILPGSWLLVQIERHGTWFIREFFIYQLELFSEPVASHGQPFYYHPLVLLVGCFPLCIVALRALWFRKHKAGSDPLLSWMRILFWVVLILFSLVTTKIVHYSSLCFLPLALLGGEWLSRNHRLNKIQLILFWVVGGIWTLCLFAVVYLGRMELQGMGQLIQDPLLRAQLSEEVHWGPQLYGFSILFFIMISVVLIKYSKG